MSSEQPAPQGPRSCQPLAGWHWCAPLVMACVLVGCGPPAAELPSDRMPANRSTASKSAAQSSATTQSLQRADTSQPATAGSSDSPAATSANLAPAVAGSPTDSNRQPSTGGGQKQNESVSKNSGEGASSPASRGKPQELPPPRADDAGGKPWVQQLTLPIEYWEGQYLNSQRIGVTRYKIEQADRDRLRLVAATTMTVMRGKQALKQSVTVETLERANGEVESFFETIADNNGTIFKYEGSITDGRLLLKATSGSQANKTVAWPATCWGPMGVQQLLWREPMASGERRVIQLFLPQAHQLARVTLVAGEVGETTSPQGMLSKVLPIDVLMQLEKEGIAIRLWTNSEGHILKTTWLQGLNLSSYRVTKAAAEQMESQGTIDLLAVTSINVTPPLSDADQAQRITYKVESSQADPHLLFSKQTNQTIGKYSPFQVELNVIRPQVLGSLPDGAAQATPGPECLAPSAYIGSTDGRVAQLAAELAGDERQPAVVAQKLTEGVHATIRTKNFSNVFDSAQDVARTLEGDCTEHAVLLAAVLRSRNVPSRIASGLVITTSEKGTAFLYHMWTEAWLGDRWMPLDATTGRPTHCGYIKFLETALEGENPYTALLPVLRSLGNLKISVLEKS